MYTHITNLPDNIEGIITHELGALSVVWSDRKSDLAQGNAYREFIKRLQREWAIETGIIERLYSWERGITDVLIEQGIDSALIVHRGGLNRDQANNVKNMIDDQVAVIEGLFAFVKDEQPLTEHFIRSMHAQFTAHQHHIDALTPDGQLTQISLLRGEYKKLPNNPRRPDGETHEYCPPEIVQDEMARLIQWYTDAPNDLPPEVLSAWLHHRFTQIHPFQDGNGRVARSLASLVFLKKGLFPLVIRDSDRIQYIDALEKADANDLVPLVTLFAKRQRESIMAGINLEQQLEPSQQAGKIISSAVQALRERAALQARHLQAVYPVAVQLLDIIQRQIRETENLLNIELSTINASEGRGYHAQSDHATIETVEKHPFYQQINAIAEEFRYFANLGRYHAWGRLSIQTEEKFQFIITIHGYGSGKNGIMAVSAFTSQHGHHEGATEPINLRPAMKELFQFNYAELPESSTQRFEGWLEEAITIALTEWQRTIL